MFNFDGFWSNIKPCCCCFFLVQNHSKIFTSIRIDIHDLKRNKIYANIEEEKIKWNNTNFFFWEFVHQYFVCLAFFYSSSNNFFHSFLVKLFLSHWTWTIFDKFCHFAFHLHTFSFQLISVSAHFHLSWILSGSEREYERTHVHSIKHMLNIPIYFHWIILLTDIFTDCHTV